MATEEIDGLNAFRAMAEGGAFPDLTLDGINEEITRLGVLVESLCCFLQEQYCDSVEYTPVRLRRRSCSGRIALRYSHSVV